MFNIGKLTTIIYGIINKVVNTNFSEVKIMVFRSILIFNYTLYETWNKPSSKSGRTQLYLVVTDSRHVCNSK